MNDAAVRGLRRAWWTAGWPARALLVGCIHAYRLTLGTLASGRCRFTPSCSFYAEEAIRRCGAVKGSALAVWRLLRCSPLSKGGVDPPPVGRLYEGLIQSHGEVAT